MAYLPSYFFPNLLEADSCVHRSTAIPACVFGWQQHSKDMFQPEMARFIIISHCPGTTGPDTELKASAASWGLIQLTFIVLFGVMARMCGPCYMRLSRTRNQVLSSFQSYSRSKEELRSDYCSINLPNTSTQKQSKDSCHLLFCS